MDSKGLKVLLMAVFLATVASGAALAESQIPSYIGPSDCPPGYKLEQTCSIWGPSFDFRCYVIENKCVRESEDTCLERCADTHCHPETQTCDVDLWSCQDQCNINHAAIAPREMINGSALWRIPHPFDAGPLGWGPV